MSPATATTRKFTKEFSTFRKRQTQVTDRGRVIGYWTPAPKQIEPVDILARQKADGFNKPLPFTGAQLLKEGKKR